MYCLTKTTSESLHIYILRAYMRRLLNAMTLLLEVAANWRYIPPSWKHCVTLGCLKWVNVQLVVVKLYTLTPFMTQGGYCFLYVCITVCFTQTRCSTLCPPPPRPSLSVGCLTSLLLLRLETLSFDTFESNGQTLLCLPLLHTPSCSCSLTCYLPHLTRTLSRLFAEHSYLTRLHCDAVLFIWEFLFT